MYSGTTFRHHSGNIIGVHQRIDRVAKRHLIHHIGHSSFFPSITTILHFEGRNGPDGIKSKSPSHDEPWHYISPNATPGDPLITIITDHLHNLAEALKKQDEVRAGFEAAWLSHAITDGLTPAHHYPLAEKIEELWGKPHTERKTKRDKVLISSNSKRDMVAKNWQYWGTRGVFNLHWSFELGIASSISTHSFKDIGLSSADMRAIEKDGFVPYFFAALKKVNDLDMYELYAQKGWSVQLGRMSRQVLVPTIMKTVCMAWYAASKGITS